MAELSKLKTVQYLNRTLQAIFRAGKPGENQARRAYSPLGVPI
jgi:hypothetical protein